tara:strand:+ start:8607 stop:9056 length:450 start_codon:yes stop_codon:yes gene_type:complete
MVKSADHSDDRSFVAFLLCWLCRHSFEATMMDLAGSPSRGTSGFRPYPALTESRALKCTLAKCFLQIAPDNSEDLGKGQNWYGRFFPASFALSNISPAITIHLVSFEHDALAKTIGYFTHSLLLLAKPKYTNGGFWQEEKYTIGVQFWV